MYVGIIKLFLLMTRLLNMQQTNFMYSQSVIKVTKGTAVQFTRSRENNSTEEPCIPVSHHKMIYTMYCYACY